MFSRSARIFESVIASDWLPSVMSWQLCSSIELALINVAYSNGLDGLLIALRNTVRHY